MSFINEFQLEWSPILISSTRKSMYICVYVLPRAVTLSWWRGLCGPVNFRAICHLESSIPDRVTLSEQVCDEDPDKV